MNTMAPIRPAELHACRVHLTTGPAAAAKARNQVRAAAWALDAMSPEPLDPRVAGLRPVRTPARTTPVTRVRLPGSESPRAGGVPATALALATGGPLKMISSPRREQTVSVHALPGAASFTACLQLFRRYPLAVTLHSADGGHRSMVLTNHVAGLASFFVLTQVRDDLFVMRSWHRRDGINQEIRPGEPVSGLVDQVVTGGVPVPHDGALLGWVTDSQVTVLLTVHCRQPATWDDPAPVPEIRVMPMAGTSVLLHWPPFTASPLDDGCLWEYAEWGQIVDLAPLVTQSAGRVFWVPSPDRRSARHEEGCVVITDNLPADEYWLPAGVYMDHWALREGIQPPPAGCLLTLPAVVDLAHRLEVLAGS